MSQYTSPKQAKFLSIIGSTPGITTAEIHQRIGAIYLHGQPSFTYETVDRLVRTGRIRTGSTAEGLSGIGLYLVSP